MPDPTPLILELSNQYRRQLLARERRAATALVRYYGAAWGRLQGDIRTLQAEIEQQQAAGVELSPGRIFRLERMQAIQQQVEREMAGFAEFADSSITAGKREAIAAGQRDAHNLVRAAFPKDAAISVSFATMPREAAEQMVGFLADGSPLRDLLVEAMGEAATGFSETMVTGLVAGWNPRKLARELRSRYGMGLTRALRISRTEQLRAYREATRNTYQANSHVVRGWERHAAADDRTCAACLILDGKHYSLDEPMDDHAAGRCSMTPLTVSYKELGLDVEEPSFQRELGRDWLQRQDEGTQRRILGHGVYELWQEGRITLDDVPKLVENKTWGNSWVPKSLKELAGSRLEQAGRELARAVQEPLKGLAR